MNQRVFKYITALFTYFVTLSLYAAESSSSIAAAAGTSASVSFNPTPGDVSIVFLGNIFGVVDGVLAGSGSQIVGQMFAVFNSAVLALGGIIAFYVTVVATMNTAHEGQVLGQKWSSLWIPIRTTVGIGLLLPKASGYCTMQIFVMWIVVQGIGAADSIWSAALNYLNAGGVIVQKQLDLPSGTSTEEAKAAGKIMNGAMGIAAGQVCMLTVEDKLNQLRDSYLDQASGKNPFGPCNKPKSGSEWDSFCKSAVPDFLSSVNITSNANLSKSAGSTISQDMPSFDSNSDSPYDELNGVCGTLSWDVYKATNSDSTLSNSEQDTIKNSRSIAVYQMYTALLPVSSAIVNNAPVFTPSIDCDSKTGGGCVNQNYAKYAYGMTLSQSYSADCKPRSDSVAYSTDGACIAWGNTDQKTAIFNGKELQDAVAAYNGIMMPTLTSNKLNDSSNKEEYAKMRDFIREAESTGWLMAGAYFFRLAILNSYVLQTTESGGNLIDTTSNLSVTMKSGAWKVATLKDQLSISTDTKQCRVNNKSQDQTPFCNLSSSALSQIASLLSGDSTGNTNIPTYQSLSAQGSSASTSKGKYNLFTYLINANSLVLPSQTTVLDAGLDDNTKRVAFNPAQSVPELGDMHFGGGKWNIAGDVTTFFWNGIIMPLWNMLLDLMMQPIMLLFDLLLSPIIGLSANIFNNALEVMRIEGVNPILAIANMGVKYIDGVGNAWMAILAYGSMYFLFPPALAMLMIMLPVVMAWMGVMVTVGFSAAYYVPFVPLLMFTFAGIGWFIGVIESMVAAPIVALGITHPEGHEAFGKAESAIMLILGMFLRPSMMIMGYIFGIILSYVGVWVMNAGFNMTVNDLDTLSPITKDNIVPTVGGPKENSMYGFWSNIFLFYFTVLTYSTLYVSIVQQAFQMIYYLPDKVLKWIGGGIQESLGESAAQGMNQEVKGQADSAGQASEAGMGQATGGMMEKAQPMQAGKGSSGGKSGQQDSSSAQKGDQGGDDAGPSTAEGGT